MSPAQTSRPAPVFPTIRPWPKSTICGQLFGLGGGDQRRCTMSQRAVPAMIVQPMLPLGDLKVARWTVAIASELAGLVVVGLVVALDVDALAGVLVLAVLVLVTVTVCVPLEPQPQTPSAHAIAAPMRFITAEPICAPSLLTRWRRGVG